MEIKWRDPARGMGGHVVAEAYLPDGYFADIIKLSAGNKDWVWTILDAELKEVAKGIETSLVKARQACEDAWREHASRLG